MKITALKTVYWDDGFEVRSGKVKTVMEHHAEVVGKDGTIHLIPLKKLSNKPIKKTAGGNQKIIISG